MSTTSFGEGPPPRSLFDLTGKKALVTGGSRGIGLMVARGLLQAGASVIISSRKADACSEARKELSRFGEVVAVPADLSSESECHRLAEEAVGLWGDLDVLVNNAGATWGQPLAEFPTSAWDKVLDLNLKSPFWLIQALLPTLRTSATEDDPSRIINVGSIDAIRVNPVETYSYASSKAAMHQLTRVLARELGPQLITVNAVAPAPFPSKMMQSTLESSADQIVRAAPLGRIGRPDDMAGIAVFLASRASSYITGAVIPVDGGIATTATGL